MASDGAPGCAVRAHRLLLRPDVVVTAPVVGGLHVQELDKHPETLFRIHDAGTGQPAGWFSAPVKHARLVDGAGSDVHVVDTSTGAVFKYVLPNPWESLIDGRAVPRRTE